MTSPSPSAAASRAPRSSARVRTLRQAGGRFWRHASPWFLTALLLLAVAGQLWSGQWRWAQLAVVAAVVLAQPFVEWLVHVYVLHARPRRLGPVTIDLYQARKHRAHHADPRDLDILFIPLRGHLAGAVLVLGACALLPDAATRLALVAAVAASSLAYEWTHFLIHTDYKPRTALYRRLYVGHRLHHYRNENYWFGVSRRLGDTVLRTDPAKEDVPLSPTCLTLSR
jgi:hypothetical protein